MESYIITVQATSEDKKIRENPKENQFKLIWKQESEQKFEQNRIFTQKAIYFFARCNGIVYNYGSIPGDN